MTTRAEQPSPGRSGPSATVEVDPRRVGPVRIRYNPVTDGSADPGEIVWTWVPYQEADGRGKDRPVLVVARETGASGARGTRGRAGAGTVLAVALTSKPHDDVYDVGIGSGRWDAAGRPSWVRLERVFRVHPEGMRREAVALDARRFQAVADRLVERFGWTADAVGRVPAPARGAAVGRSDRLAQSDRSGRRDTARPARTGSMLGRALRRLFGRG